MVSLVFPSPYLDKAMGSDSYGLSLDLWLVTDKSWMMRQLKWQTGSNSYHKSKVEIAVFSLEIMSHSQRYLYEFTEQGNIVTLLLLGKAEFLYIPKHTWLAAIHSIYTHIEKKSSNFYKVSLITNGTCVSLLRKFIGWVAIWVLKRLVYIELCISYFAT